MESWAAPRATGPVSATVTLPGSKSITNRALVLAALADGPSTLTGVLRSRDTDLMLDALTALGITIVVEPSDPTTVVVTPAPLLGAHVDCGLAGTVMRFVPPMAALADGVVTVDGDDQMRARPVDVILRALRDLGVGVSGDALPFSVHGDGAPVGGTVTVDASASSQFVSGLLLAAARYRDGITVHHVGKPIPSQPHIDMTVSMVRESGVAVDDSEPNSWSVAPSAISPVDRVVEPDLSNAAAMGAHTELAGGALTVHGPQGLQGVTIDLHDVGELTPTIAALCALAESESVLSGIAHLRGHETDRLAALSTEINRLGGRCSETADGLRVVPAPLHGGLWRSYADHRMATAGALVGLCVEKVEVDDIGCTAKTLPDFPSMWAGMLS